LRYLNALSGQFIQSPKKISDWFSELYRQNYDNIISHQKLEPEKNLKEYVQASGVKKEDERVSYFKRRMHKFQAVDERKIL